jgi:hypothetical protein
VALVRLAQVALAPTLAPANAAGLLARGRADADLATLPATLATLAAATDERRQGSHVLAAAAALSETVAQICGVHVHSSFWKLIPQVGDAFSMGVR